MGEPLRRVGAGRGTATAGELTLLPAGERALLLAAYRGGLPLPAVVEARLGGVVADVLRHPGSLARSQLAVAILRSRGIDLAAALPLGVALEYFHAASLLFDDLPAMDDATVRRGRPCPHRVYGEGPTLLAALAFVTRAYDLLWRAVGELPPGRRRRAGALVAACLGIDGVLNGQALDITFDPAAADVAAVTRVAEGKTVALIRLALVLPALVGGAGATELGRLERLARAWGLAYQLLDDCKDALLERAEAGKSTARDRALGRPNLPAAAGWPAALARLDTLLGRAARLLEAGCGGGAAATLRRLHEHLEGEAARVRERLAERPAAG